MIDRSRFSMLNEEEKAQYKFKFCELCDFYECELVGEYQTYMKNNHVPDNHVPDPDSSLITARVIDKSTKSSVPKEDTIGKAIACPTYDQNELKNGCVMNNFSQIECGSKRVTEGIDDHFKINTDTHLKYKNHYLHNGANSSIL